MFDHNSPTSSDDTHLIVLISNWTSTVRSTVITSAKEVTFYPASVCPSRQLHVKSTLSLHENFTPDVSGVKE